MIEWSCDYKTHLFMTVIVEEVIGRWPPLLGS